MAVALFSIEQELGKIEDMQKQIISFLEIEKESYITGIKDEIQEINVLKGLGTAGKAVGKFIGSIPLIKEGPADEFLQDSGVHLKKNAIDMEKEAVHRFASISDPGIRVFIDKMEDMI